MGRLPALLEVLKACSLFRCLSQQNARTSRKSLSQIPLKKRGLNMKKTLQIFFILICVCGLVGCKSTISSNNDKLLESSYTEPKDQTASRGEALPADLFEIEGTVTYQSLEGGFYAIDGTDGRKYDPINLPEAFKKDGLRVKGSVRLKEDVVSFHMYGEFIEIVELEINQKQ
jgi:hypothetical protein